MDRRTVLVGVLLLALAAPGTALAKPDRRPKHRPRSQPPACNLVVDVRGDAAGAPLGAPAQPTGNEPAYDLVGADIATDERTMTAAIRVAQLAADSTNAPVGMQWRLDFAVVGSSSTVFLQAFSTPFGIGYDVGYVDGGTSNSIAGAAVTGVFDVARSEVRISAPLAAVGSEAIIVRGSTLTQLRASAGRFYSTAGRHPSFSERTDEATGTRAYAAGSPSCVPVGA